MKALIISNYAYPERGLSQLISILTNIGVKSHLMVDSLRYSQVKENYNNLTIYSPKRGKSRIQKYRYKVYPFFNSWKRLINDTFTNENWHCVFVRETLLLNTAISIGQELEIPVFLDVRENRPEMILENTSGKKKFIGKLYAKVIEFYEKLYLKKASHIFAVSKELKEWLIIKYNTADEKISVLPNYPNASMVNSSIMYKKRDYYNAGALKIVFAGNVSISRGLQHIIPALQNANRDNIKATLHIIGEGDYLKKLRLIAYECGIENEVTFQNMVNPADLIITLSRYDVGLLPYIVNSHTNVTVPGKLFEYMAAGLPILSSSRKSVVRILEESKCGIVYYGNKPEDIAASIKKLMDPSLRQKFGSAGVHAICKRYNENTNIRTVKNVLNSIIAKETSERH